MRVTDSLNFKHKDKEKEWKKNWKDQAAEKEYEGGKTTQEESSFLKQKRNFGEYFTCGSAHMIRDLPVQVKVNVILSAELEREKHNEGESSKYKFFGVG